MSPLPSLFSPQVHDLATKIHREVLLPSPSSLTRESNCGDGDGGGVWGRGRGRGYIVPVGCLLCTLFHDPRLTTHTYLLISHSKIIFKKRRCQVPQNSSREFNLPGIFYSQCFHGWTFRRGSALAMLSFLRVLCYSHALGTAVLQCRIITYRFMMFSFRVFL